MTSKSSVLVEQELQETQSLCEEAKVWDKKQERTTRQRVGRGSGHPGASLAG